MKLKSINIHGFKSFADRVTISYDDCITGVIGPNGSGKSNVIDAVRWVMGEQTAKSLRADDPTDIIFAGSQTRKPMGMAEVTLTFTNDGKMCPPEYMHLSEVSITRRIYRDGEREYLMNKESCRLKDISNFLMSIGLGSRTYSIIQQEKRDRIVQAKPDDLRAILEETAGITVFKQQRKEAEKRLHSSNEQLEKLDAVEGELAKLSQHLSEQVAKTKRKIELSKELRETEIGLLADNIAFHKHIALFIKAELAQRTVTTQQSTVDTAGYEAEASRLTAEKIEITGERQDIEEGVNSKRLRLTQLTERRENQLTLSQERQNQFANLEQSILSEEKESEEQAGRLSEAEGLMDLSEREIERYDGELESLMEQEEEAGETARNVQSRLEELKSESKVTKNRLENTTEQIRSLEENINILQKKISEKHQALEMRAQEKSTCELELKQNSLLYEQEHSGLSEIESEISKIEKFKEELNFERKKLGERHEVKHRQLVEVDARLRSLKELAEEDSGTKDKQPEILRKSSAALGSLFEHFQLSDEYEDRLEQALPELAQALISADLNVVLDLSADSECQASLRRHFFHPELTVPLSLEEQQLKHQIEKIPALKAARNELTQGGDHPLSSLFDRIYFCEAHSSLTDLIELRKTNSALARFIFVMPGGSCLFGHGELRVGKSQDLRAAGILKRRREMLTLQAQRDGMFSEVRALESEMGKLDLSHEEFSERTLQLREKLTTQKESSIRREAEIARTRLRLDHFAEAIVNLEKECLEVEQSRTLSTEKLKLLSASFEQDAKMLEKLQNRQLDTEETAREEIDRSAELKRVLSDRREQRQEAAQRLAGAKRTFEELTLQLERSKQKIERVKQERAVLADQLSLAGKSHETLAEEIENLRAEVGAGEAKLEDFEERIAELTERIHVVESKISGERDAQLKFERLVAEKQTELARAETILETQYKDAWERFGLSESDFTQVEPPETDNREKLETKIRALKKNLENLGPINEAAVTEFEETEEKLSFLRSQKQDITSSIEALRSSIDEVEERTKISFLDTYTKVGKRFENLFPILFPGGEARLNLVDPENLLETGVEILVRLPGKRMQNMSLFSGGEKALTAISLIFALLQTSPAPFCYLDEVDAPLDEANVGRFNSVLDALSDQFQFVVITHNRRTMEVLDTSYGISMAEPGVSRLVSVDLSEVPGRMQKQKKNANQKINLRGGEQQSGIPAESLNFSN